MTHQEQITKVTVLSFNDGQRFQYTTPAYCTLFEEGVKLRYSEPDMQGLQTTLLYQDHTLSLSRNDGTRLSFKQACTTAGVYCLPYGTLDTAVHTEALSYILKEEKGVLSLCYKLSMGGQDFSCKMKISFENPSRERMEERGVRS
ncbi:MAG: DUF1934 domain-containing protein [Clostridia bacterium]|nr:DUF1934 domain-containing protein [Clostridia bacterium]